MKGNRAPRAVRVVRWARLVGHLAGAVYLLGVQWPRAAPARREVLAARWSQGLLALLAVRIEIEGSIPEPSAGSVLIAANHISWLDIFAINAVRHTRFIAKQEIRRWPLAGWIAARAGTLFLERGSRRDAARTTDAMAEALRAGHWVGLFPEGTTTAGDELLRFHSALFEPAIAHGAPVQPVALRYEHPDGTLLREAAFVGEMSFAQSLASVISVRRTVLRVVFPGPLSPEGVSRRELATEAHRRIAARLNLTPPSKAPETRGDPPGEAR